MFFQDILVTKRVRSPRLFENEKPLNSTSGHVFTMIGFDRDSCCLGLQH